MRQILEDEATTRKAQMMKEMQQYNQMLAQEKRDREAAWFADQQSQNAAEIERQWLIAEAGQAIDAERLANQNARNELRRQKEQHDRELHDQAEEIRTLRLERERERQAADAQLRASQNQATETLHALQEKWQQELRCAQQPVLGQVGSPHVTQHQAQQQQ